MKYPKLVSLAVMLAVFGSVAGTCWALAAAQQTSNQPPPNNMPKLLIHEQIRDAAIVYIVANHPETAQFVGDLTWTGGRQETGLLGSETYLYQNKGWAVTLKYPVVADPVYSIIVDYSTESSGPSIPCSLSWQGTWHAGSVAEASYVFAQ